MDTRMLQRIQTWIMFLHLQSLKGYLRVPLYAFCTGHVSSRKSDESVSSIQSGADAAHEAQITASWPCGIAI